MKTGKWCYSFNEENFEGDFDTEEQAIAEAIWYYKDDEKDQDFIWIGQVEEVGISFNIDYVIEAIQENAYDKCGEYAENYLDNVTNEHRQILEDRVQSEVLKWMKEFKYEPNFWTVKNVEKIDVTNHI
jgi:hypothetical protein